MIHPKHLRVGNRVWWDKDKNLYKEIEMSDFSSLFVFDKIEPIPLTPEILEKLGFEHTRSDWFDKKYFTDCIEAAEVMKITINAITGRCAIMDTDLDGTPAMTGIEIKYLHQLQNLYFSLTGTELNYQQ